MMAKSADAEAKKADKQALGRLIKESRGKRSLRSVANAVGIPPSNLKYIEDGVNAPGSEVYAKLIDVLCPPDPIRKQMDRAYMIIRNTPPPDICGVVTSNEELADSLRILVGHTLTPGQFQELNSLLRSFAGNQ